MDIRAESSCRTVRASPLAIHVAHPQGAPPTMRKPTNTARIPRLAVPLVLVFFLLFAAACSSDSSTTATDTTPAAGGATGTTTGGATCGKKITLGYSAWPGWFPWAVADREGPLRGERCRRRDEVLLGLHLLARRHGRGRDRRQQPDVERHHARGRVGQQAGHRARQRQLHWQRRHHRRPEHQLDRRPDEARSSRPNRVSSITSCSYRAWRRRT